MREQLGNHLAIRGGGGKGGGRPKYMLYAMCECACLATWNRLAELTLDLGSDHTSVSLVLTPGLGALKHVTDGIPP